MGTINEFSQCSMGKLTLASWLTLNNINEKDYCDLLLFYCVHSQTKSIRSCYTPPLYAPPTSFCHVALRVV